MLFSCYIQVILCTRYRAWTVVYIGWKGSPGPQSLYINSFHASFFVSFSLEIDGVNNRFYMS